MQKKIFVKFRKRAGFTLIEMIVVITIFAIIGVGITASFMSGMRIWGRAQNVDFARSNVLFSLDLMARDLRHSVGGSSIDFEGSTQEITFPVISDGSIVQVTYYFDELEKELRRKETDLKDIIEETGDITTGESVVAIDGFSLTYLYHDKVRDQYVWNEIFEAQEKPFKAVLIKVKFNDEEFTKTIFIPIS
ncbi:MAG: type II secretion system protein [Candidatus Omnitrophota bacterium]